MSPLRRHGGGRPRSAHSILDLAECWGISEKAARRLVMLKLSDDLMVIMVNESAPAQGKYSGGMRALGMRSRIPAGRA